MQDPDVWQQCANPLFVRMLDGPHSSNLVNLFGVLQYLTGMSKQYHTGTMGGRRARAVVRHDCACCAVLLFADLAIVALATRVNHAADCGKVTHLELGHVSADVGHDTQDLVAWYHWVLGGTPLVSHLVDVRVAHADVCDLQLDVVIAQLTALELRGGHPPRGVLCCPAKAVALTSDYLNSSTLSSHSDYPLVDN
jgi:hypothetical protein